MRKPFICITASLAYSLSASAAPIDAKGGKPIVNNTDSLVLSDTNSPDTLWVLPPNNGTLDTTIRNITATDTQCQSILSIQKQAQKNIETRATIQTQLDNTMTELISATEAGDKARAEAADAALAKWEARLTTSDNNLRGLYRDIGSQFGGNFQLLYKTKWVENTNRVRQDNPDYRLVQQIPTQDMQLYFTIPGSAQDGLDVSMMPSILSYSVQGQKENFNKLSMSDILGADLALTTLGGCLMAYPNYFGTNIQPVFALSAVYSYPRAYATNVTAKYNVLQIYKLFRESGRRSSLFSSKSFYKEVESNWGRSAFYINWEVDDPNNGLGPEQRLEIERNIKADLLASVASLVNRQVAAPTPGSANAGPTGAAVISDALGSGCGEIAYCRYAAIGFKVLDGLFGSSSSRVEVERTLDVEASYSLSSTEASLVTAGTNYAGTR